MSHRHHHGGRVSHYAHIAAVREINQRNRSGASGYPPRAKPAKPKPEPQPMSGYDTFMVWLLFGFFVLAIIGLVHDSP